MLGYSDHAAGIRSGNFLLLPFSQFPCNFLRQAAQGDGFSVGRASQCPDLTFQAPSSPFVCRQCQGSSVPLGSLLCDLPAGSLTCSLLRVPVPPPAAKSGNSSWQSLLEWSRGRAGRLSSPWRGLGLGKKASCRNSVAVTGDSCHPQPPACQSLPVPEPGVDTQQCKGLTECLYQQGGRGMAWYQFQVINMCSPLTRHHLGLRAQGGAVSQQEEASHCPFPEPWRILLFLLRDPNWGSPGRVFSPTWDKNPRIAKSALGLGDGQMCRGLWRLIFETGPGAWLGLSLRRGVERCS